MSASSFYTVETGAHGQERFFASELTRGPWSNDHQHGGPPSALLARVIEATGVGENDPPMLVTRMSVELLRPIPIAAPLEVEAEILSAGRRVHRVAAALISGDRQLAVAVAVRMRLSELRVPIPASDFEPLRPREQCPDFEFPFFQHAVGYHTAMELKVAAGEFGQGRMSVWMRPRVPLLPDEPSSTLQRVMICADAGHGVGTALDTKQWSFINPDLSVHLHRLPSDEWLGMSARTTTEPMGVGLCQTQLSDRSGPLGVVLQGQLISAVAPS